MNETLTLGVIGTWQYMAPEIMTQNDTYNESCDVYSFGIMMHEIFTLSKPYVSLEIVNQFAMGLRIINGYSPSIPPELWKTEESARISVAQYFFKSNELSDALSITNNELSSIVKIYFELCISCRINKSKDRPTFDQIIVKLQEIEYSCIKKYKSMAVACRYRTRALHCYLVAHLL